MPVIIILVTSELSMNRYNPVTEDFRLLDQIKRQEFAHFGGKFDGK
jgi:hypothetical protein